MAKPVATKYRSFVTCAHRDRRWGKWLHGALQNYRIDKDLAGRSTSAGRISRRLRPIFFDRECGADGLLSQATLGSLKASQSLIVICSPDAAKSSYINETVRHFKLSRGADRIIPFIVGGEPGDFERGCFPSALCYKIDTDGVLTWEHEKLNLVDARPGNEGNERARQKVLARLLGASLDEIIWRAERARERRRRAAAAITEAFLTLCAIAAGALVYAWQHVQTNDALLNATLKLGTQVVSAAVDQAEKYKVPHSAMLEFVGTAERMLDDLSQHRTATKELRYRKAWMLMEFARNYETLGRTEDQRARGEGAQRYMAGLAGQDQHNTSWQNELFATYHKIGDMLARQGALDEAVASYRTTLSIMERVAADDPQNRDWQRNVSLTHFILGSIFFEQGAFKQALDSYRRSFAVSERIGSGDALNSDWQADLADIHIAIGHVFGAQNRLSDALKHYQSGAAILDRLATKHPAHAFWRSQSAYARYEIGNLFRRQGAYKEALKNYRQYLAAMQHLVSAHRDTAKWQEQLWRAHWKVGDVLFELGAAEDALKSYRESLAAMQRLANADPGNVEWQRNISLSYTKIGRALMRLEEADNTLASYRKIAKAP